MIMIMIIMIIIIIMIMIIIIVIVIVIVIAVVPVIIIIFIIVIIIIKFSFIRTRTIPSITNAEGFTKAMLSKPNVRYIITNRVQSKSRMIIAANHKFIMVNRPALAIRE